MKTCLQKIRWQIFIVPVLLVIFFPMQTRALEVETHRAVNEYIAGKNIILNGFSLHQYLIKELGLKDGVETVINKKWIIKLLGDGGEYEDKPSWCVPYWRSRNHFHNPINNSGFSGWWDTGIFSGMSAIDWAMQPVNSQSCGYYSWNDARGYYYKALTSTDKATRETNFADTFRAIGQSMHLVQDISVPEHTRNNGHYFFYSYEVWAKDLIISDFSAMPFTPSSSYPLRLENLFDTEQYNGTNPDITLNSNIGLSEYTSANFLSPDTIFNNSNIPYPAYSQTELNPSVMGNLYLTKKGYGDTNGSGERINHLARAQNLYNYLPADYKELALTVKDPLVYQEYASKLVPRAIGYSSQVLSYFFRGKIDLIKNPDNPSGYVIMNETEEAMEGTFTIYYDAANNQRLPLWSGNFLIGANNKSGNINLAVPTDAMEPGKYMLVFQGRLGNEMSAVVGKYISGYWEPWERDTNDPYNLRTTHPWLGWVVPSDRQPFGIIADEPPNENNGLLRYYVKTGYLGSDNDFANDGIYIPSLSIKIPDKKLFIKVNCQLTGAHPGFYGNNFYNRMFLKDIHGTKAQIVINTSNANQISPTWTFTGYLWIISLPGATIDFWNVINDGMTAIPLTPLTDEITYISIETGYDWDIESEFKIDFINFR